MVFGYENETGSWRDERDEGLTRLDIQWDSSSGPHMISFHYVAQYESTLLFQILAAKQLFQQQQQQQQQTSSLVVKIVPWRNRLNLNSDFRLCSANDLLDIWPSSTAQLGGYGRRLKGKGEAELLFHLLFYHIKIYDSTCSDWSDLYQRLRSWCLFCKLI